LADSIFFVLIVDGVDGDEITSKMF